MKKTLNFGIIGYGKMGGIRHQALNKMEQCDTQVVYEKNRDIKVNYDDLPGPKVSNWDELLNETNKILYDKDLFVDARNNWKNKIYKNLDGNNCKRIAEYFKKN